LELLSFVLAIIFFNGFEKNNDVASTELMEHPISQEKILSYLFINVCKDREKKKWFEKRFPLITFCDERVQNHRRWLLIAFLKFRSVDLNSDYRTLIRHRFISTKSAQAFERIFLKELGKIPL